MIDIDLTNINNITSDSRKANQHSIFVAIKGIADDGHQYINDAIVAGCKTIVCSLDYHDCKAGINYIQVAEPRITLSELASRIFQPQPEHIVAVTGTSGKTSVAYYVKQIIEKLGEKSASIGTLGVLSSDYQQEGGLTTPSIEDLHKSLQTLAQHKVHYVALEASSHGLHQYRLDHVKIQAAAITNFSHEHLDYHHNLESYFAAKMRLFNDILPEGKIAILNSDMAEYSQILAICKASKLKTLTYGKQKSDLTIKNIEQTTEYLKIELEHNQQPITLKLPYIFGDFQAYNVLCAALLVHACDFALPNIFKILPELVSPPGRMEKIAKANIFVDYAHKVEALEKVLTLLRKTFTGKVIVVFGCGGDRDKEKRPLMGAIANQLSDHVIITDDNPRTENPATIRQQIIATCPKAIEVADRAQAIQQGINLLNNQNDVLIIAGKGHEKYQILGDQKLAFDDCAVAREAIKQ